MNRIKYNGFTERNGIPTITFTTERSSDPTMIEIQKAVKAIWMDGFGVHQDEECTVELMDENDEDGPVVLRGKNGTIFAIMPQNVFDQLRELGKNR